jgi:hypothetical protein
LNSHPPLFLSYEMASRPLSKSYGDRAQISVTKARRCMTGLAFMTFKPLVTP